ncbi:interleukin-1 receptor type 2-like isoform X2 [Rhinatrema bivittatum]|uniref:interleukin-1 receptor type 2-like isoform X2 n=1 Tax=Rhinatrema bivittatum TaxID=194408 RepID=UPI00112AA6D7|nr:interleukin-1 receptor type 2-like isoform X2 [Rhinatrema bivittatum]
MPSAGSSRTASDTRRILHAAAYFLTLVLLYSCAALPANPEKVAVKRGPKIREPRNTSIAAEPDKALTINCTASFLQRRKPVQLIYWLANGTFVEEQYPDGRVTEGEERTKEEDHRLILQRPLQFTSVKETDFALTFTCVVQDPSGLDKKEIRLRKTPPSTQGKGKVAAEAADKCRGQ